MATTITLVTGTGSATYTVSTGSRGPAGTDGATGPAGATGATGPTGPAGSDASVTQANVTAAITDKATFASDNSLATSAQGALADSALQAASIKGVIVTKANGTRTAYPPSADTDTARGLALEAAFAAAVAGDTIDLSPGNYEIAKTASSVGGLTVQYQILSGMTLRLNGARLYHLNTSPQNAACMFYAVSVDDWAILGPGKIEGAAAASSGTNEIGINTATCRRWIIDGVKFINWRNTALQLNSSNYAGSYSGLKVSTGHISNCNFDYNNYGVGQYQGNEYVAFTNCTFNMNLTAFDCFTGNAKFVGCEMSGNTNYAMRLRGSGGGNYGHGEFVGGAITHNAGFAVAAESGMNLGWQFVGVTFGADSTSTNKIQSLGAGLNFVGCYMESPFFASSTPGGLNFMKNCFIAGTYTDVTTDLLAAERLKWVFLDNHTTTGGWAQNDDQIYSFADNTAALAGGLTAGRRYRNSSTNAISTVV